jgi:hypothetical protein
MPARVPPGSFVLPLDVIKTIGGGNLIIGEEMVAHLFPQMLDASHARVLPPHVVSDIGEGSIGAGRQVLRRFIELMRQRGSRGVAVREPETVNLQELLRRIPASRLRRMIGGINNITALSIKPDTNE